MELENYDWVVSDWVREKLAKFHEITMLEIEEAIANSKPPYAIESRAAHRTKPPTFWFIASTMGDRLLKVAFVLDAKQHVARIKTAYDPEQWEIDEYESY